MDRAHGTDFTESEFMHRGIRVRKGQTDLGIKRWTDRLISLGPDRYPGKWQSETVRNTKEWRDREQMDRVHDTVLTESGFLNT